MGRASIIPDLEKKIGEKLKEFLKKQITAAQSPEQIGERLGVGKSLVYEFIKFYELKELVKQMRRAGGVSGQTELENLWDEYNRQKKIANFSPATIARSEGTKKNYLWWLRFTGRPANIEIGLSKDTLTEFMFYLSTETKRWGAEKPGKLMNTRTVIQYRKSLAALINWLIKQEKMEKDPLKTMIKPKTSKRMIEDLPDAVIEKVLVQMKNDDFAEIRDKTIVMWFIETGMRLSGVANVEADQFNLDTGWGKVIEKGNKERAILLTGLLRTQLKRYMELRAPLAKVKKLWLNQSGNWFNQAQIGDMIRKLNDLPGVKETIQLLSPGNRIHPHIFRHVWAKHMALSDVPIQAIQVMGGWDTIELVMYYAKAYSSESAWGKIELASPLKKIMGAGGEGK